MRNSVTQTSLKIGVIGAGCTVKRHHLPALDAVQGAEVVAVADPDRLALREVSTRFNVARCVADSHNLLEDSTIDAIAICVPVPFNVGMALAALEAGKHVFIEKPLALTLPECDRLLERTAGLPLQVMVGFNIRWHRLAQKARDLVRQGRVGALKSVRSVLTSNHAGLSEWRTRRSTGGGVLFEAAMHHFDLWRYLSGGEIEEVCAQTVSGKWEDESAAVCARLSGGALAAATFVEGTSPNNGIEVCGSAGALSASFYRFDGLRQSNITEYPGGVSARVKNAVSVLRELPRALPIAARGGDWHQSYIEQWKHFVESIRTGGRVECGLEDGRRALAVALAAGESVALGKTVSVPKP